MLRSWLVFEGPIRHALHSLKYHKNVSLGEALAKPLAKCAGDLGWMVDIVVPVPLGKKRNKDRGYNQVCLVAKPLARINHWNYAPMALTRLRETRSQVGLTTVERRENVVGAFRADSKLVSELTILLIDDVATTGATLSACAMALLDAGASTVNALTLARALPHSVLNNI
jgi:ComF family protein